MDRGQRRKEFSEVLKRRSRAFAIDVIVACRKYPRTMDAYIVARQLIRAATGVAANYRAACRARSRAEFAARIAVACEEADESQFWLELSVATKIADDPKMDAPAIKSDKALLLGMNAYRGHITCKPVAAAHKLEYVPIAQFLG